MFVGANGAGQGPFIRKYIARDSGLGSAYERVFEAQRQGRRFLYIPRIADCYTLGEDLVVIMEYVRGETLQDVVYRCDPSMQLAADIFPRLCDAVLELHEGFGAPLIHRDLKPSNVMVSSGGLSLIDLGIAREYKGDATTDTHHFGTRAYAPPEQFGFGQTTVRSDVYALGMILYFCLVEQTPDAAVRERGFLDPGFPTPCDRCFCARRSSIPPFAMRVFANLSGRFAQLRAHAVCRGSSGSSRARSRLTC
ncbi:MAG: serine/threonine protein kinase [Slackia sp.]